MRVSIEHKEVKKGLIRKKTYYCVACKVELTEEEKQIIRCRNLGGTAILQRPWLPYINPNEMAKLGIPEEQNALTIGHLCLPEPNEWLFATIAEAKLYDAQLHEELPKVKSFIMANAEMEKATSFEL